MPRDFKARQILATQIIGSGGIHNGATSPSSVGLMFYSSSGGTDRIGGMNANMTSSVGSDVWMFVSGSDGGRDIGKEVVLFGGDVVVSGTFYVDRMVVEIEEATTGSFSVSGSLFVSASAFIKGGLVVNDEGEGDHGSASDFRVETKTEDEAILVDASADAIYFNKGESAVVTTIHSTNDVAITVGAAGVVFNEDSHATNDFRVESDGESNAIFVDSGNNFVELKASELHLTGSGAHAAAVKIATSNAAGGVDIDAGTGGVAIDSTGTVSIDGADDMNFTITSSTGGEDLTIQQIGGNDSSIIITAAGTGTDAIKIDATAGDMLIGPTLTDGKTLKLGKSGAVEVTIAPHGTAASEKYTVTNTAGTAADAISLNAAAGGILVNADASKIHLDADGTGSDAVDIDSEGGIDVTAADAIVLTTTSADGHIKLATAHTSGLAFHIDADAAAGAIVDIDAGILDIDVAGNTTIDSGGTFSIDSVGASNVTTVGILTLSGSTQTLVTSTKDTAIAVKINASHTAGGIDIDAGTGGIAIDSTGAVSIQGSAASDVTVLGAALTISGSGVNIAGENSEIDITTAGAVDINAGAASTWDTTAGDITIDANAGSVNIDGGEADSAAVKIAASHADGGIDIDAGTGGIAIDSTSTVSIDGVGASNLTTKGILTLSGSTQTLVTSTKDTAIAVRINASHTAGGIDIDAGTAGIAIDSTGVLHLTSSVNHPNAIQMLASAGGMAFKAAGAAGEDIDVTNTAGSINIIAAESVANSINIDGTGVVIKASDTTNGLSLATATSAVPISIGHTTSETTVNDNLTVIGNIGTNGIVTASLGFSGSLTRLPDGKSFIEAGSGVTVASASNGAITISTSGGGSVDGSGAATRLAYWSDSDTLTSDADLNFNGSNLGLTGSSAGANSALDIDRNYSATTSNSATTAAAASGILIDYDVTGIVGASQTQRHKALWVKYDQSAPSHNAASIVQGTGLMVEMTGSTDGIQSIDGIYVKVENPGSLAADASRGISINAPAGWIDGTSNGSHLRCFSQADTGDYFDISVGASGITQLTTIDSDAAVAHLNLKPDGMAMILSGAASGPLSRNESTYADTNFFVSGSVGSIGTSVKGASVFGGDVYISGSLGVNTVTITTDGKLGLGVDDPSYKLSVGGNMEVGEYIYHRGDADTFIRFQVDSWKVNVGNVDMISITEDGSQDKIILNEGGADVDFRVESSGEDEALFLDAGNNILYVNKGETDFTTIIGSTNDEAARFGDAGVIFNEDGHATNDFRVETDNKTHGLFVDAGTDQVLILSGGGVGSTNDAIASDVNLYVSGAQYSQGSSTRGTTLFGGDIYASGTILGKQYYYHQGTYQRGNADAIFLGLYGSNEAASVIDDVTMVAPFSGRCVRIIARSDTAGGLGSSIAGFHQIGDGTEFPSTTAKESIGNVGSAAHTPLVFDFTLTGTSPPATAFSAGDCLAFSLNPTNNSGEVNFCIVLEYITHRIISGTTV